MFKDKKHKDRLLSSWRIKIHEIIFEADTPMAKAFDVALLWAIIFSVIAVMLESVKSIEQAIPVVLRSIEWFFTILFTVEYIARIISSGRPLRYIFSFLGLVDLIAVIPTYLSLFFTGYQYLLVIRTIRLLRVFRIFKLSRFLGEANILIMALRASRYKITVFLGAVLTIVVIMGTIMYLIEGEENGFTSIPRSLYWAIVTLTTVGYGDIAPKTVLGQAIASIIMIIGYAIIAVPTGIVSVELANAQREREKIIQKLKCQSCPEIDHDDSAYYCKQCGSKLEC